MLLEDLRAGQGLLSELREDPLEDAILANLRLQVMAEVWNTGSHRYRALGPLLALAAALILATILMWPRHAVKPAQIAHVAPPQNNVEPAPAPEPVKVIPVRHRAVRRRHARPRVAEPGPPLLVQFATDNPEIVIYWLVDQKQGD